MRIFSWIVTVICSVACAAWGQVTYQWTDISPSIGPVDDLPHVQVEDVGVHPLDPKRLLVVGGFNPGGAGVSPYQAMYSDDGGRSWSFSPSAAPLYGSLFVNVARPGVAYVAQAGLFSGLFIPNPTPGRLYRSDDFGRSWSLAYPAQLSETVRPIAPDPLDSHGLYATYSHIVPADPPCAIHYCVDTITGLARSPDDGLDWGSPQAASRRNFSFEGPTPSAPTRVIGLSLTDGSIVSFDGGATWAPFAPTLATPLRGVNGDPLRANVLYGRRLVWDTPNSYHSSVMRSDNGGLAWREILVSPTPDPRLIIDPAHPNVIWVIDWERDTFLLSDNRGETWQSVPFPLPKPTPNYSWPRTLVLSPGEPGVIYAVQYGRLFRGTPSVKRDPVVVEFHYDIDRYWITSLDDEAVSQDWRKEPGNVFRTGERFGVWRADDAPAGAVGSCRFWPKPQTGWRTRILVLKDGECESIRSDPNWILEGEDEFFAVPGRDRATCPAGLVAVRRFHNLQPDFNHRWVADPALFAEMRVQRAWYDEGVRFCARPLGNNE